jgi:hypothetical protein
VACEPLTSVRIFVVSVPAVAGVLIVAQTRIPVGVLAARTPVEAPDVVPLPVSSVPPNAVADVLVTI